MKLVFTPDWFLGGDVVIEFVSFLVLFAFFILSYKSYKLSKNKKSLYLGIGFLIIALAELATIFTKLVLYYDTSFTQTIGSMVVSYKVVHSVDFFYNIGFFFHRLLTLLGLYVIYKIPQKKGGNGEIIFAAYILLVSAFFGDVFYYIFHITALILLALIIESYLKIHQKNKSENTMVLIVAFFMLAIGQMIFVLSKMNLCYVIAQMIQLVSYLILLFLIIRILRIEKKK